MEKPVYFFSDAHLGASAQEVEKTERLFRFLDHLKNNASAFYILGDLFDFWFNYRYVMPRQHFRVINRLEKLAKLMPIAFFAGNHDYWAGQFFESELNIKFYPDEAIVTHFNKKIYLHHGDGILKRDGGYRLMKKVLRNPLSIFLFRWIHPDIAFRIAKGTSHTSRGYTTTKQQVIDNQDYYEFAQQKLKEGIDAVIMGHRHCPEMKPFPKGFYLNTGDWVTHFSYVRLAKGVFSLETFN